MKRCRYPLFLITLVILGLVACGSNSSGGEGEWETYTSSELGIRFELPVSWATREEADSITFANEETLLEAELISGGGGGYVSVEPIEAYGGSDDPKDLLELLVADFTGSGALKVAEPVTAVELNGQKAATVMLEGLLDGQSGTFVVVVIIANDNLALILGIDGTDEGEYTEFLSRIAESMVIQ